MSEPETRYQTLPGLGSILRNPSGYIHTLRRRIGRRAGSAWGKLEVAVFLGAVALLAVCLGLFLYVLVNVPEVERLDASNFSRSTVVYTADGEELTRYYTENRSWVPLDSVAPVVVDAVIATEDRRFYDHSGVDVVRTGGAIFQTLAGETQGGSTITMQLARNAFADVGDDFILERKLKEWLTSLGIERKYSKDEILETYLNTIPFNYNAFGIEAAARTYFDKPAVQLDTLEAATLVGMLKGTTIYNPVQNPEASRERRNVVLQQMLENGILSPAAFERLRTQETPLDFNPITPTNNLAPYFAEHVREWLDDWAENKGHNLYTGGLRVFTTLDADMQLEAEAAVREQLNMLQSVVDVTWSSSNVPLVRASTGAFDDVRERIDPFSYYWQTNPEVVDELVRQSSRFRRLKDQGVDPGTALNRLSSDEAFVDSLKGIYSTLQAGFVAMNPNNGHVKAWVGGRNFEHYRFDHVADARRQPGSTFKPFVYAAALQRGISPLDSLRDATIRYVDENTGREWSPSNFGRETDRMMAVRAGLAESKNTITSRLMMEVGPDAVADMARRMGVKSDLNRVPSLALGTSEVKLLELTAAYSTIANQGIYHEPLIVERIEDADGRVLATFRSEERRAIEPELAYGVLDMMRGVIDHGTGVRLKTAYGAGGDLAGKTGTTQDGADGWFMLIHPELVTGSWVGFPSPLITFRTRYWGQGSHNALRIVGDFYRDVRLSRAARFRPPEGYTPPEERRRRRAADTTGFELPDFDFAVGDESDDSEEDEIDAMDTLSADAFASDTGRVRESEERADTFQTTRPDDAERVTRQDDIREDTAATDGGVPPVNGEDQSGERDLSVETEDPDETREADSEVERLNRQEREESQVGEYLDRLEDEKEGDNDG